MTVEFFGVRGIGQLGGLNKIGPLADTKKSAPTEGPEGASFSSALQGAAATQAAGKAVDPERAARVQELKAQVSSGQYEPDLQKVASSLLKFLVEG
jgi:negative regulator of flagellin synthesis FlgM